MDVPVDVCALQDPSCAPLRFPDEPPPPPRAAGGPAPPVKRARRPCRLAGSSNLPRRSVSWRRVPTRCWRRAPISPAILAVISAYTVSLRAPISGYLADSRLVTGAHVTRGEVVAHMRDPDTDVARLQELRQRLAAAHGAQDAVIAEQGVLRGLQEQLAQRGQAHDGAATQMLAGQIGEASRVLEAKLALRDQQMRESERHATLERAGFTAHAEADRLRTLATGAAHDAEAQRSRLESLLAQHDAAMRGIMVDGSGNDVSYSMQRADELTIRLAELDRALVQHRAEAAALDAGLAAEARRVARLADSPLVAPATGMVWKMSASEGERLAVGDPVVQVVDCRAAFLLVSVPQDRLSGIAVGTEVRFRLAGETVDRVGQVAAVTGESADQLDRTLAVLPPAGQAASGTLRIASASRNELSDCLVGRTVRVLIPAGGDSMLNRLGRIF